MEFLVDGLEDSQLVFPIADGEVPSIADPIGMSSQNPDAKRMKGAQQRRGVLTGEDALEAVAHFLGCLVGEGDGQNLLRLAQFPINEMSNLVGEGPGLAAPRSGQNEHGAFGLGDGKFLLRVQMG